MQHYRIRPLDADIATTDFHCGQSALDDYIQHYANQDVKRSLARAFIATPAELPQQLAGYFTLSAASISASELPETLRRKLPRYPLPVALLGRLAVASHHQGQGLGGILLADALLKVCQASQVLAMAGMIVDAKDDKASAFYRHHGFIPMPGQTGRMLLPAKAFPS
ncbi:MAG: GNAT family N-acetyltransferase [Rhodocyclales bacterium]|nr:GNAT family N-acetyltransferase [Rhodocyclales bacterium]